MNSDVEAIIGYWPCHEDGSAFTAADIRKLTLDKKGRYRDEDGRFVAVRITEEDVERIYQELGF